MTRVEGPVGRTSSCGSHSYGLNGIGMRKGAQYKVYSTLFNILGPIPLIRHTRVGLDSLSHLCSDAANHAIFRPTAFYRAAMPSQAAY